MSRRQVGLGLMILGGVIAAYFLLVFRIAERGADVVNMGLMNDRSNGMMFGGGMAIVGVILYTATGGGSRTIGLPASIPQAAPVPPAGWNLDPNYCSAYPTAVPLRNITSYPAFCAAVRSQGHFTKPQLEWGWSHGIPAGSFGQFVGYIEAYRLWAKKNGVSVRPARMNPLPPGAYAVGFIIVVLWLSALIVAAAQPKTLAQRIKSVKAGDSDEDVRSRLSKFEGCSAEDLGVNTPANPPIDCVWKDETGTATIAFDSGKVIFSSFRDINSGVTVTLVNQGSG